MECYFLNVYAEAQLHAVTSDCYVRRKPGFHTDPAYSLAQFLPCLESQGGESNSSGPTSAEHQARRKSVRRAECVRSPLGQGCARQASFLTGHTLNVPDTKR